MHIAVQSDHLVPPRARQWPPPPLLHCFQVPRGDGHYSVHLPKAGWHVLGRGSKCLDEGPFPPCPELQLCVGLSASTPPGRQVLELCFLFITI